MPIKLSTIAMMFAIICFTGCAAYPDPAKTATDRAKLASIELKPAIERAYIIDEFEKKMTVQQKYSPAPILDTAALASQGTTSLALLTLSSMSGNDDQDVISKFAFPRTVKGQVLRTTVEVDDLVSNLTIDAALTNGFTLIEMSADRRMMLFGTKGANKQYLRVYNFGEQELSTVQPHMTYAWGFRPVWISRKPASYNLCWGSEIVKGDNKDIATGIASDGRELPLVVCERSIPDQVSRTIRDLTATGYFVYANKSIRVNRLYFEGIGYNPNW